MQQVIFLDIDGVLSTDKSDWNKFQINIDGMKIEMPYSWYKPAIDSLNNILTQFPDIKIIMTSDWILYWSLEEIDKMFKYYGLPEGRIIDKIDKTIQKFSQSFEGARTDQILEYIKSKLKEDDKWLVIDDYKLFSKKEGYDNNFVHVLDHFNEGLASVEQQIIEKLKL